jgi:NADH-quinone oxidoreductase subunit G
MSATVPQTELVTVTIDGVDVRVPKGTLLVEAAKSIQRDIPVYCYHEKLGPAGLCRICLVEIDGMPKLQIACNTPVTDGMKVHTTNPRVDDGRRAILEFFLLNHPLDCPICDKGGECDLQDYSMAYGQGASRSVEAKMPKPKAVDLGPTIVLDEERCIVCQRCVRFDDVITREQSLRTDDRGPHTIIATASGEPYVSDFTGNVTELCPVGALTSKTYRFRSRPWDNHRTTTSCTQCSVGCAMHVDERGNALLRTMSVADDDGVSDSWLCDRGRYNVGFVNDDRRITQPLLKRDGEWVQIGWDDAIDLWAAKLKAAGAKAGVIGGGRLLNEEAYLAAFVHRALGIANLDHRIGAQTIVHHDGFATAVDLENADTIITLGRPPSQLAPVLDLRIRKAVARRGARLISVGDHAANSFVPETRATTGAALAAALTGELGRVAMIWDGVMIPDGPTLTAAMHDLGETHVDRYILPEDPNGRGADALGMRPVDGGLTTRAMFEAARDGNLGLLAILGANPMLRFPDGALVRAALESSAFVVVTDLFMTETAELADLVLPVCSAFEKTGTTTNACGEILPVVASVRAPDDVIADGDVLVLLAEAMGVALPDVDGLEQSVRALVAAPPTFGPDAGPPDVPVIPAGALRIVRETTIFTGGGTLLHDARIAQLRTLPRATLHPATAAAAGVVPGDVVRARTDDGAQLVDLVVVIDPRVPEGAVALVDGIAQAPVNVLGAATSVRLDKVAVLA